MKLTIKIKNVGKRHGTVGWLKQELESGNLVLEEKNNYYIPAWLCDYDAKILTHSLVLRDKKDENSVVLACRTHDGYRYDCVTALSRGSCSYGGWDLLLTDAAISALESICSTWVNAQNAE